MVTYLVTVGEGTEHMWLGPCCVPFRYLHPLALPCHQLPKAAMCAVEQSSPSDLVSGWTHRLIQG